MTARADITEIKEGMLLSGCRVIAKIGEGGMGCVYKAIDENLERMVAIKVMRRLPGQEVLSERFHREAKFAAKMVHPGIAQVYSAGELDNFLYYIMEFVDGPSLDSFFKKARLITGGKHNVEELILAGYIKEPDPALPYFLRDMVVSPLTLPNHIEHSCNLIISVAEALSGVHKSGSIHRDIKPSNIIISQKDEIKLVDFGLVKGSFDPDVTRANQFVGTLKYMAPEQFLGKKGEITSAVDIYSLGVVFYELVTLARPFDEEDMVAQINLVVNAEIEDPKKYNSFIPEKLCAIIKKCLAKDPKKRFGSVEELIMAIRNRDQDIPVFSNIRNFFFGLFGSPNTQKRSDTALEQLKSKTFKHIENAPAAAISEETAPDEYKNSGAAAMDAAAISRSLYEAALKKYFEVFMSDEVTDNLNEALDLNPQNIEAVMLYYLLMNHGMVHQTAFDPRWKKAAAAGRETFEEKEKMIFDIIDLHMKCELKTASTMSVRYHHLYPDDLLMTVLMGHIELDLGNFHKTLELYENIIKKYPDFAIARLFIADIRSMLGSVDECLKIIDELKLKYPANRANNFVAIQNLTMTGRLDEAQIYINEAHKNDPDDADLLYFRQWVDLYRGNVKEAMTAIRMHIGLTETPEKKAMLYYRLYRICTEAGEPEKARQYLRMANTLSPENTFKSYDQIRNEIDLLPTESFLPENIKALHFGEAVSLAKEICFKSLSPLSYAKISNLGTAAYYHIEESCAEHAIIYTNYRYLSDTTRWTQAFLERTPISPFIDSNGTVLDTTCKKCATKFGNYLAMINYSRPQKCGETAFFMTQFEPAPINLDSEGRLVFRTGDYSYWTTYYHGILVSFPSEFKVKSASHEPDKITEIEGRKFYHYIKFFFTGQKFPLEIIFEK